MFITVCSAQLNLFKKKNKEEKPAADSTVVAKNDDKDDKKKNGGFFQKVVGKAAKIAGGVGGGISGMVGTTDNLQDVDMLVSVGTNIYSKDLGLITTDFLGKDWINNGDFTMLQISSKDGFKFYKYGGTIKVNDKELKHVSMGVHTVTENPNSGVKKISFIKDGKTEGSFEVPLPAKNIKLLSINGQSKNVKVDLTKDVTMELANYSTVPDALVRVDLLLTTIGLRSLYLVAYVKPAAKVTIPAAAFRNIETANPYNFKSCYLAIADQVQVPVQKPTGIFTKPFNAITGSNDGMWIDVTASDNNSKGIKVGNTIVKKNAAYAMPLSFAKKVAVSSFYTYGTTYLYEENTNRWTQTESKKTIDFPEIPDAVFNNILEQMYQKFTATLTQVNGSIVLPASTIPALPSYENATKFYAEEVNNDNEFLKVYQGLNPVKGLTTLSMRLQGENALLAESKADGLLKVKLVCQLSWDKKPTMTPYLTIEMDGASNGGFRSFVGNTQYFSFTIKGDGYELKKNKLLEFDKMFQVDAFNEQFKNKLAELKKKEAEIGDYEKVWEIQQ